jgi:hypothetical protein
MKAILWNVLWISILCAFGWLCATQIAEGATPAVRCATSSFHGTIEVDGHQIVLHGITVCSNGGVTLAGRTLRCQASGIKRRTVNGRLVLTSSMSCR